MKYTIKDSLLYRALSKNGIAERYLVSDTSFGILFWQKELWMLTKEDLLTCNTVPNIDEVSLELYRNFAETYLIPRKFHYEFLDGDTLDLEFTEWGIYHMLSIQHIDRHIKKLNFFEEIKNGLSFNTFKADSKKNKRFRGEKKRITMFACVYNTLLMGTMFYLPNGCVRNTVEVEMDYISYMKMQNIAPTGVTYNGINIGIRKCGNVFVPLTILVSPNSDVEEYIKTEELKVVKRLTVADNSGNVLEEKSYSFQE